MITDPAGVLAVLLGVLAVIFWFGQSGPGKSFFRIVPALLFCYFVPTTLTTLHVIPDVSPLYSWIKAYVLPAALLLLILALDVPAILRLGPKAVIMLLAGTAGVVVGGPVAFWIGLQLFAPESLSPDLWRGFAALSGSWIGGGANFVAIGSMAGASDEVMGLMVIPDVLAANVWMGALLFFATIQHTIDRRTGADASAIRALEHKLEAFQARVSRIPSIADLMKLVGLAFVVSWIGAAGGNAINDALVNQVRPAAAIVMDGAAETATLNEMTAAIDAAQAAARESDAGDPLDQLSSGERSRYETSRFVAQGFGSLSWKFILVTTIGLALSFTPVRNLEGAGASKLGGVFLYLLVATIGAGADFTLIVTYWPTMVVAFIWIAVHVIFLLTTAWLIKAPIFFVAVGSQANIGGAASAPVVAAAYHPALAPVGALLAVAGYVLGTYAGMLCMWMLRWVAQSAG